MNYIKKIITNKEYYHKETNQKGKVVFSNSYLITFLFEDKTKKNFTVERFRREFALLKTEKKKEVATKYHNKISFTRDVWLNIRAFINSRPYYKDMHDVVFQKICTYGKYAVKIDGILTGYMVLTGKRVLLSYYRRVESSQLAKYRHKTSVVPREYLTYKFEVMDRDELPYFQIAFGQLLLGYKEMGKKLEKKENEK